MAKRRRGRKGGGWLRSIGGWALRILVVVLGAWLLFEAWRFPDVGAVETGFPAKTSLMRYRERQARRAGKEYRVVARWVPLGQIGKPLVEAVRLAEDARFYAHQGFDTEEIREALEAHFQQGKKLRGASTISQQLAKNLWLDPQRSLLRKLREAVYTYALERRLTKDRILELYLNVVEWGPGIFGAEAAANRYFNVSARELTPEQAALLATALPNPLERNPARPSARHRMLALRLLRMQGGREPAPTPPVRPTSADLLLESPRPAASAVPALPPARSKPTPEPRPTPGPAAEPRPVETRPRDLLLPAPTRPPGR